MRISRIEIKNYRQHQQLELDFPQSKEHDLHIIVAQNGIGKTNLLNAITWCLYEDEPHLGDKNKGLPLLCLKTLNVARQHEEKSAETLVRIFATDEDRDILFERKALFNIVNDIFEKNNVFTVREITNGNTRIFENEDADVIVNKYMPKKIKEYFYFDGEQLNEYFTSAQSTRIHDAIFTISQVDVLKRIQGRLSNYIKDQNKEASKKSNNISDINAKLEAVSKLLQEQNENKVKYQEQIFISKKAISDAAIYLSGQENFQELEKSRASLRDSEQTLKQSLDFLRKDLLDFIFKMKIAMTFYKSAKLTYGIIDTMQKDGNLPPNIDKDFLVTILEKGECLVCGQTISKSENEQIMSLVEQLSVSSQTSNILSAIKSELGRLVETVHEYPIKSKELYQQKAELEKNISHVRGQLQEVENKMSQFRDEGTIRQKVVDRIEHEKLLDINQQKFGVCKNNIEKLEAEYEAYRKKLDKDIAANKSLVKIHKQTSLAQKCLDVAIQVEDEMKNEIKEQMQQKTAKYFLELMWKKNTYLDDCITLNDDFQLDLIHPDGFSALGTSSAAERCLLALSFTLALHKVSGFNSLIFIDTPLARISDVSRMNFSDVLVEATLSKQFILTLTPAEFSAEVEQRFKPIASTFNMLTMLDEQTTQLGV